MLDESVRPDSPRGQRILVHELVHASQALPPQSAPTIGTRDDRGEQHATQTVDALTKLELPAGVEVEIRTMGK